MSDEWYVVRVKTQNGMRLGIDMDDPVDSIAGPMSETRSIQECTRLSEELGIPEFDENVDVWIGDI